MPDIQILLVLIILIAIIFDYTNGVHDSANAIATVVSTKVLSPRQAVMMAAVLNLLGAFLGTHVASTIGKGIVNAEMIANNQVLILAALVGAIIWNLITWFFGLPSSSSHALIGGLIGAAIGYKGWASLNYSTIIDKIIIPLFMSPIAGFIGGYLLMLMLAWITYNYKPRKVSKMFRKLQIVSAAFMALSHGNNDAQKTMGIITLALLLFHVIPAFEVPLWVKISCALAMTIGTANGGWKIIKTMGHKIFRMVPIHGFAAETSASLVIMSASLFGAPISTTHVISSSILGVGSSKRISAVRWMVAGNMVVAWILTIPASAIAGAICFYIFSLF
ncbi:MAG: inorganic phosphate transporter [Bacteroidetes bacterium]|nr:inorganic phosphate transporter [Bacteroidota bacterium]